MISSVSLRAGVAAAEDLGQERQVADVGRLVVVFEQAGDRQRLPFAHLDGRRRGPDVQARRAAHRRAGC